MLSTALRCRSSSVIQTSGSGHRVIESVPGNLVQSVKNSGRSCVSGLSVLFAVFNTRDRLVLQTRLVGGVQSASFTFDGGLRFSTECGGHSKVQNWTVSRYRGLEKPSKTIFRVECGKGWKIRENLVQPRKAVRARLTPIPRWWT